MKCSEYIGSRGRAQFDKLGLISNFMARAVGTRFETAYVLISWLEFCRQELNSFHMGLSTFLFKVKI